MMKLNAKIQAIRDEMQAPKERKSVSKFWYCHIPLKRGVVAINKSLTGKRCHHRREKMESINWGSADASTAACGLENFDKDIIRSPGGLFRDRKSGVYTSKLRVIILGPP